MQAWFFVLMTVGNEPGNHMDHKIGGTPMTGMLDVRNMLELVANRSDDRPFARNSVYLKGA
jgi:hypothetical protein